MHSILGTPIGYGRPDRSWDTATRSRRPSAPWAQRAPCRSRTSRDEFASSSARTRRWQNYVDSRPSYAALGKVRATLVDERELAPLGNARRAIDPSLEAPIAGANERRSDYLQTDARFARTSKNQFLDARVIHEEQAMSESELQQSQIRLRHSPPVVRRGACTSSRHHRHQTSRPGAIVNISQCSTCSRRLTGWGQATRSRSASLFARLSRSRRWRVGASTGLLSAFIGDLRRWR